MEKCDQCDRNRALFENVAGQFNMRSFEIQQLTERNEELTRVVEDMKLLIGAQREVIEGFRSLQKGAQ